MADTHEIRKKLRTAFVVQASAAITAGAFSAGAETAIDNTYDGGSENGLGADIARLTINVTSAPATAATAEIWTAIYDDFTGAYEQYEYSHTIAIPVTVTGSYSAGYLDLTATLTKARIKAVGYGFTASLIATPVVPSNFAL